MATCSIRYGGGHPRLSNIMLSSMPHSSESVRHRKPSLRPLTSLGWISRSREMREGQRMNGVLRNGKAVCVTLEGRARANHQHRQSPLQRRDGINTTRDRYRSLDAFVPQQRGLRENSVHIGGHRRPFSPGEASDAVPWRSRLLGIDRRSKGIILSTTSGAQYVQLLYHPGLMWDGTFSVRAAFWFPLIRPMNCIVAMAPACLPPTLLGPRTSITYSAKRTGIPFDGLVRRNDAALARVALAARLWTAEE